MRVLVLVTWRSTTAPTNFITGMITSIVIVTASTRTNGNRGQPVADQIQKIMLRALDANIQYYTSLSRLAADCLDGLLGSIANISTQQKASSPSSTWRVTENVPARPVKEESSAPTIVLEGETGSRALGMFVVENGLSHAVSASIYVSAFTDSSGREVRPQIKVEPSVIGLKPKEQILVRVLAGIDDSLLPLVDYKAEISVPDLPGTRVALVLRRRATPTLVQSPPSSQASKPAAKSRARTVGNGRKPRLQRGRKKQNNRTL